MIHLLPRTPSAKDMSAHVEQAIKIAISLAETDYDGAVLLVESALRVHRQKIRNQQTLIPHTQLNWRKSDVYP